MLRCLIGFGRFWVCMFGAGFRIGLVGFGWFGVLLALLDIVIL